MRVWRIYYLLSLNNSLTKASLYVFSMNNLPPCRKMVTLLLRCPDSRVLFCPRHFCRGLFCQKKPGFHLQQKQVGPRLPEPEVGLELRSIKMLTRVCRSDLLLFGGALNASRNFIREIVWFLHIGNLNGNCVSFSRRYRKWQN